MRLKQESPQSSLRERLSTAALAVLLVPAAAAAADTEATNTVDFTSLYWGETGRAQVYEPMVRVTRLFSDRQSIFAQLGVDVITGASPSGALPSGTVQTRTSASGRVIRSQPGEIPLTRFQDQRFSLDTGWQKTFGKLFTSTLGGHFSREKDYQSVGVNGKFSLDLMNRLVTVTVGGGLNDDSVFPVGGTPIGLSEGTAVSTAHNSKRVSDVLFGVSRILSRRWMVAVDGSRTFESGYLTEPYKVISLMDPVTGVPVGQLTDKRPTDRTRSSLLLSSVYHFDQDILYGSYRYYTDSWGVGSNTLDFKYRHDFGDDQYVEPHLRLYRQGKADFFTAGLVAGAPLPDFATSDYRLGDLTTLTLGATVGFRLGGSGGLWTVRAEYVRQAGDGSPPNVVGVQRQFDLAPPVDTFTAVIGYSFNF